MEKELQKQISEATKIDKDLFRVNITNKEKELIEESGFFTLSARQYLLEHLSTFRGLKVNGFKELLDEASFFKHTFNNQIMLVTGELDTLFMETTKETISTEAKKQGYRTLFVPVETYREYKDTYEYLKSIFDDAEIMPEDLIIVVVVDDSTWESAPTPVEVNNELVKLLLLSDSYFRVGEDIVEGSGEDIVVLVYPEMAPGDRLELIQDELIDIKPKPVLVPVETKE